RPPGHRRTAAIHLAPSIRYGRSGNSLERTSARQTARFPTSPLIRRAPAANVWVTPFPSIGPHEEPTMTPALPILPALLALAVPSLAAALPKAKADLQPLAAQAKRVADALDLLGAPLSEADRKALADAAADSDAARGADKIQGVLDKHVLAAV